MHSDAPFREYSFLEQPRVLPGDRHDAIALGVRGAASWDHNAPLGASTAAAAATNSSGGSGGGGGGGDSGSGAQRPTRRLTMAVGDSYADVRASIDRAGWQSAYVVEVDARSLELLCEDLGSPSANEEFNRIMHTVLGVAEQVCAYPVPRTHVESTQGRCRWPRIASDGLGSPLMASECLRWPLSASDGLSVPPVAAGCH